jgi:hypothetical protein
VADIASAGSGQEELELDRLTGVAASFDAAAKKSGGVSLDRYEIAGSRVHLRFASPELRSRLTPAFQHLAVPERETAAPAALTVNLWDSASTGADPPPRPFTPSDYADGALFHFHEPPIRAAYQPGLESLSIWNSDEAVAWHWVSDAFDQPYWDQASPIRQILFWWLSARGCIQLHGAAVGVPEGGVLLVGKGGSGKSTVALSSLGSGLLYAGDDYVAVTLDPLPRVESLYSSGKLEPEHVDRLFPELLPLLSNRDRLDQEKAVIYVQRHFPGSVTTGFPLRAVLVPRIRATQAESRIVETSRADAFAALAPSTIFQLHTAGPDSLGMMSRLVKQVPCYGLEVGVDPAQISATIRSFLVSLGSTDRD